MNSHLRSFTFIYGLFWFVPVAVGAPLVGDEAIRLQALRAIFPKMSISRMSGKRFDGSWKLTVKGVVLDFPDALKNENTYHVVGEAITDTEHCASEDISAGTFSKTREVRFQLFRLSQSEYVAVTQYGFSKASPAMSCLSIGAVSLLRSKGTSWHEHGYFEFDTTHHNRIERIHFVASQTSEAEQLLVETNSGGGGTVDSMLFIFEPSRGNLRPVVRIPVRLYSNLEEEEMFVQVFEVPQSVREDTEHFCFTRTEYAEHDEWFKPPHVTEACFGRGTGVEPR